MNPANWATLYEGITKISRNDIGGVQRKKKVDSDIAECLNCLWRFTTSYFILYS